MSWVILKHGIHVVPEWSEGGRVLWLVLAVSHFFLCRASEIFAASNGKIHKEFGLTRGDVRYFVGKSPALWCLTDRVEVRFKASIANNVEAVVSREKTTTGHTRVVEDSLESEVLRLCWN